MGRLDRRESATEAKARTISIEQKVAGDISSLVDEGAVSRTEAGASRVLASRCARALLDQWEGAMHERERGKSSAALSAKLTAERAIVSRFLNDDLGADAASGHSLEQERQIA